jgi:hypothetical protein
MENETKMFFLLIRLDNFAYPALLSSTVGTKIIELPITVNQLLRVQHTEDTITLHSEGQRHE